MKITPTALTVSQLLGAENEQYVIPAYQRRYSWSRHQVQDLWDDLRVLDKSDSHLFGTIVCLAEPHKAGVNRLELVDGQQRIATISILLNCIRERLKNHSARAEVSRLLEARAEDGKPQPKIVLDSLDAGQFRRHAAGDVAEPVANPRLRQAFEFFRTRLSTLAPDDAATLLYRLKNQSVIIRLDVGEAKDAFKLFETINNRGLRLSAADILKNFILGNAARFGHADLELARERWTECLVALDGLAIDTFFRQFMTAHLGRRVRRTEVVEEFQKAFMSEVVEAESLPDRAHFAPPDRDEAVDDDDEEEDVSDLSEGEIPDDDTGDEDERSDRPVRISFATFLSELVKSARIYRQLVLAETGSEKLDRRLRNLRLIKAQQSYGFLMSLKASGCQDKPFEVVLRLTESFLMRRHTTRARANENEVLFAQLCSIDPVDPIPAVRDAYREYYPSDERFEEEFAAAVFPSRLMDRARYCLEQFEIAEQGAYPELVPLGADAVHVEHIIPQKIKTKKAKKKYGDWVRYLGPNALALHPKYVGRIGNLTLFAGELNIGASNNPYHRKKAAHAKSAFKLTQTLPTKYPEFRFAEVDKRSEALAKIAVRLWPSI